MRNRETMLIVPKASAREKKMSAFKTISFLECTPENEPGAGFSDHLSGDAGDHEHLPRSPGER